MDERWLDWEEIDAFNSNWGGSWNEPLNGVHYFRQRINVPESLAGQKATLRVGTLKDSDVTYINGIRVGSTSYQYPPRIYQVPAGTLRAGENEIVIRLVSSAGRPEFVKGKPYQLEVDNRTIPLAAVWKHKIGCILKRMPSTTGFQNEPTGLYNSMIYPLRNYGIRGAIWYQGESDTGSEGSKLYESHLINLVNDWREQWKIKNLPFVIVQLANFQQRSNKPMESGNAQVREAQRKATLQLKSAGLATAIDLGESNDIHPLNKKDLAHRCVLQMNKLAFGEKNIVAEGPMAESAELKENNRIVISFRKDTGTLKQAKSLEGIAVAAKDGKYKFVKAYTEGDKVIAQWDGEGTPIEIDAASHSGVDDIREIVQEAKLFPIGSKYKVFIVDECHSLSDKAWQALLMTLESMPAMTIFIFCTTNPEKIPDTIISRVQVFKLSKISLKGIFDRLIYVLDEESKTDTEITYSEDAVNFIAKYANGGMRDALTLLDKALIFNKNITMENIEKALGLPNYDDYFALLSAVATKNNEEIIKLVNDVYNSNINFTKWFEQFHSFIINIVKYIYTKDINETVIPSHYSDKIQNYNEKHSIFCLKLANILIELNHELKFTSYQQEIVLTYLCSSTKPTT